MKRPQLSIDEIHQLKWLLGGGLALFSVWTVFYLDLDIWVLLFVDTIAIVACVVWPGLPSYVPNWVHKAAFPVIAAFFLVDLWLTGQVLPSMVRLALMLLFYRGVSYRQRRDDLQLIVLGLFLVVLTGVITVSLGFVIQIAVFTACALGFLFTITLVDAAEATEPAPRTPFFTWRLTVSTPGWIHQASWIRLARRIRAAANWKMLGLGMVLFGGVVASSSVLFISIPRFQLENSLFLDRFMAKKSRVGFTDNIKFGDVTDIISDTSLALSIQIDDPRTLPTRPYLRMIVLDDFSDGGFKLSARASREGFEPETSAFAVSGTAPPHYPQKSWTFFYEAGISRYLPLPGSYTSVRFSERQNFQVSPRYRLIALRTEPLSMKPYQVIGPDTSPLLRDPEYAALLAAEPDGGRSRPERRLPPLQSDLKVLLADVAEITGGEKLGAEEFARRACEWLARQHSYSLQSSLPPGTNDMLVRWLNSRVPGHCEFFAGGFALLARAAGFPSRLVTGFVGGSWNPYSNSLTIRNSNAHAWCEIWDGKDSWLRVDPTPGAGPVTSINDLTSDSGLAARTDTSWSARIDSLRIFWYLRIVNFDQRDQVATISRIAAAMDRIRAGANGLALKVQNSLRQIWDPRRIAVAVGCIAALAGLGWLGQVYLRDWRWRIGARRGSKAAVEPIRQEAGRWLRRFAEIRRPKPEGRSQPASSSRDLRHSDLPVVKDLTRLRYAARESWPFPPRVFDSARRAWRTERRRR